MKRSHVLPCRLVLIGSILVAGSVAASASPCVVGSLQSYIGLDASGGCSIGAAPDNVFSSFGFSSTFTGNATVANASEITVTPIDTPAAFGLAFSATVNGTNLFSTPAGSSVTYYIDYNVDPLTGGPDLTIDPVTGDVSATQTYHLHGSFSPVSLSQTVSNNAPPGSLSSTLTWPVPPASISLIEVETSITLDGPASFDALIATFSTATSTSAVPEPANFLLAGFGLSLFLVLIYLKRSYRQRRNER